jgi:CBS domain-containing protein
MKVQDVIQRDVITVTPDLSYAEVARILHDNKISGAPVVDDDGALLGIISEKDLLRVLYPRYGSYYEGPEMYTDFEERENKICEIKENKITHFMTTDIVMISLETPIMKIGGLMLAKGVHRLPVVENGILIGIVTRGDIFKTILKDQLGLE